jgi:hypothetical protein
MKIFPLILAMALTIVWSACISPPDYPIEPVITYIGISKKVMNQKSIGSDSLLISFSYTDGDGDLGSMDTSFNIRMIDERDGSLKPFNTPVVNQQGAGNGISGDITILFSNSNTCCTYEFPGGIKVACEQVPIQRDTLRFRISLKDRAGHESNQIVTDPLILICK